jgi:hypothetical protein
MRDTDLILTVISSLQEQGELQSVIPPAAKASAATSTTTGAPFSKNDASAVVMMENASGTGIVGTVMPYIKRAAALQTAHSIFEKWLPDNGNEYLMKIRAMPAAKSSFYIDFDDFLEITMEQWVMVKGLWIEHLSSLFHHNSNIFRVISECQFAMDSGNPDRDTVLAQMIRDPTNVLNTRPARLLIDAGHVAAAASARKTELYEKNQRELLQFGKEPATNPSSPTKGEAHSVEDEGYDSNMDAGSNSLSKKESTVETGHPAGQSTSGAKETVVELMTKKSFVAALKSLKPDLSQLEVLTRLLKLLSFDLNDFMLSPLIC